MEIWIAVVGALSAITVALLGAVLTYRNNSALQLRKIKEDHYIAYIEALHNLTAYNPDKSVVVEYTYYRDKLLIIGSEEVVRSVLLYENEGIGKENYLHDKYLTEIIRNIRKDLRIKDKNYPDIYFKKG